MQTREVLASDAKTKDNSAYTCDLDSEIDFSNLYRDVSQSYTFKTFNGFSQTKMEEDMTLFPNIIKKGSSNTRCSFEYQLDLFLIRTYDGVNN